MKDDDKKITPESAEEIEEFDDTSEITAEDQPVTISVAEYEELQQKARERDEFFDKLQRTTADFINYQKRARKERENLQQFAVQELAEAIVPCLDNFDHAINHAEGSSDQQLLEGVKLVEQEFLRVLGNFNIERMESVGQKFDPNIHEAVLEEETDKVPHQTVLEEFRPGYVLNGRVIRAAQVKVSRHPNP